MSSSNDLKGSVPLRILQVGCGSFGVHLKKHLEDKVKNLTLVADHKTPLPEIQKFELIFLATNDSSLGKLVEYINGKSPNTQIVHFSGFHYFDGARGLHPVASFNKESKYDLNKVTFVSDGPLDRGVSSLFPSVRFIEPSKKQNYHNFLSVTANALQVLVHNIGQDFEKFVGVEADLLKKIVIQSLETEKELGEKSFSGPWVRGEKNLQDETLKKIESESLKRLNSLFKKEIEIFENSKKEERFEHS